MPCPPFLVVPLLLTGSLAAQVCSAGAFGSTTQDPLTITGTWTVGDACVLDFGPRHVILDGVLNVQDATIYAAKLTVNSAGRIDGSGGQVTRVVVRAAGAWDGSITIAGKVRQNDAAGGGDVYLDAGGDVSLQGTAAQVEARGIRTFFADGGWLEISAGGDVVINGSTPSLSVSGSGGDSAGGDLYLTSTGGSIQVLKKIDATGGDYDGGYVTVWAPVSSIAVSGPIDCSATSKGYGGEIWLEAGTDISVTADLDCDGGTGTSYYGGGDGGFIDLYAGGNVSLAANASAEGGIYGYGGDYTVLCGGSYTQTAGTVSVKNTTLDGTGGTIYIEAGGAAVLHGDHDASGDSSSFGGGGSVEVSAQGGITHTGLAQADGNAAGTVHLASAGGQVASSGDLRANGTGSGGAAGAVRVAAWSHADLRGGSLEAQGAGSSGRGGDVIVAAGVDVLADAATRLWARGNGTNGGTGGTVVIDGCRVSFPASSQISARGNAAGSIAVLSGDVMTLAGEVRADGGAVTLTTRLAAPYSPILAGATIAPAPLIVHDATMAPCLAKDTTTLTANSPISIGAAERATLDLKSAPSAGIVVLASFTPAYLPIGAYGYQQLDPLASIRVADFGRFGPPIAGSTTSAAGTWSYTSAPLTNPTLIGRTIYLEAYVAHAGARNGLFHQTPLIPVSFVP